MPQAEVDRLGAALTRACCNIRVRPSEHCPEVTFVVDIREARREEGTCRQSVPVVSTFSLSIVTDETFERLEKGAGACRDCAANVAPRPVEEL